MGRKRTVVLLAAVALVLGADVAMRVRRPVCPGLWFPADPAQLYSAVSQYVNEANVEPRHRRLAALLVPNGGYSSSGAVAGHAFKLLEPGQYDRVIVITPSHYARFRGCSIASVHLYRTPLGDVPLDASAVRSLCWSPLFRLRSLIYRPEPYVKGERVAVHEQEHGIEVQLPFLQVQLGEFRLVPVVVGELEDYRGGLDHNALDEIVESFHKIMDDRTLLIVSANFTHFGPEYGFVPFRTNILEEINRLDAAGFDRILERDVEGFQSYLARTGNNVPGHLPLIILMKVLPEQARGVILAYDTSGRMTGDPTTSVSYVAIAFFDPAKPPAERRPVRTLITSPNKTQEPDEKSENEGNDAEEPDAGEISDVGS